MLILLLLQLIRNYHPVLVSQLATSHYTHVEVTGKVILVKLEQDGDWHIRISDGKVFIVAEIIPELPLTVPKLNDCVIVHGIRRYDNEIYHNWAEVHPVEQIFPCVK